jgi:hypothetical protein
LPEYAFGHLDNRLYAMKLDKEQKRVLKAITRSSLGFIIGYPLIMWIGGKLDS